MPRKQPSRPDPTLARWGRPMPDAVGIWPRQRAEGEIMDQAEAKHLFEPTGDFQCLHEFLPAARAKLSDHIWGYLVGATETETTLRRNRLALDSLALRPRVCVDVVKVHLSATVFG